MAGELSNFRPDYANLEKQDYEKPFADNIKTSTGTAEFTTNDQSHTICVKLNPPVYDTEKQKEPMTETERQLEGIMECLKSIGTTLECLVMICLCIFVQGCFN